MIARPIAPVKNEDLAQVVSCLTGQHLERKVVIDRIRANFPRQLQELDQWLLFRYEKRGGKLTKVPYQLDGSRADVTDPITYSSFENACNAYLNDEQFDGIGFVFTPDDPYCGVDLDQCIVNEKINSQSMRVIGELLTYTEKSISRTGIHLIARATLPAGGRKSKGHKIEFYDEARFFVVTGDIISDTSSPVEDRQAEIENLHERIFPPPPPNACNKRPPAPVDLADQELIDKMFLGNKGAKIRALWDGDSSAYDGDESAGDLALCNALAFWCGRDPERMDRLFQLSQRMRNKWNRRARRGETYGQGTIRLACLSTQKVYTPGRTKSPLAGESTQKREQITATPSEGDTRPPRYMIHNGCICEVRIAPDEDGNLKRVPVPLCNFTAKITADVLRDDGEEITRQLAITGVLDNGRRLQEILVNAADFGSMDWVAGEWGGRPIIEPGQSIKAKLRHAIQVLSAPNMAERHLYEHTGWRMINGQRAFLHAGGAIGISGISGVSVDLPGRLSSYKFPDDDAVAVVDAARASIRLMEVAPARITMPLWAMTYYAPLSEMLVPAFLPNIEGPSGAKKSTLTALFVNHYGASFHEKHMPDDWMSTANSIERNSFLAKDVLFVVDDYRPAESRAEEREQTDKLGRITRSVGNRAARGRLTSSRKSARTYVPRGVVAMTAELGATGRSVVARQFTITVKEGDVDLAKLTAAQQQRHLYSYAMRGYIDWLRQNYDAVEDTVNKNLIEQRNEFATSGMHGRLPDTAAQLYIAFDVALMWATTIGAISKVEADRLCADFKAALRNMARQQNDVVERENPASKFMSTLVTLLAQGRALIAPKQSMVSVLGNELGERIGHWDGNTIFLYPPAAVRMVNQFVSQMGSHFGADTNTLGRDLRDADWLVKTSGERTQVLQRVEGYDQERSYFYAISMAKFNELVKSMGFDLSQIYQISKNNDDNIRHHYSH